MTREEALNKYIIPALNRTWNEKTVKQVLEALELSADNEKALSGRLSDKERIIQLIEGHKGCQTQINLVLSKIVKEIEVLL